MALIKRINVKEFKVVSFFSEPGPQEVLTGNIWNLTDESTPTVTEDFNGVVRTSVLLVYLEEILLYIPNMYYGEFTNLPPNPQETINPATGAPFLQNYELYQKDIGWVRLTDSLASIYYEYCSPPFLLNTDGRLPVSKNYFSHDTYGYNTIWEYPNISQGLYKTYKDTWEIVDGNILPGNNNFALRVIDTYDFYNIPLGIGIIPGTDFDAISFGPNPLNYPFGRFEGYDPVQYFQLIINPDGLSRIEGPNGFQDVATLKTNDINQIDLLYNTRTDIVTPGARGYTGIDSDVSENGIQYDDGKRLRWGYSRTILQGYSTDIKGPLNGAFGNQNMWYVGDDNRTVGECISFDGGGDGDGDISEDPGVYPRLVPDKGTPPKDPPFCDGCPPADDIPIKVPPLDILGAKPKNIIPYPQEKREDNSVILRSFYETVSVEENTRDPRQLYMETLNYPKGYNQVIFNKKLCEFHILPALRDKDGDIPEPIGGIVSNYFEDIREQITNRFFLKKDDNVLKELSYGTDGYTNYSDGKSYKELLGESLFGCGDYFSFDKIPEIFVELYPREENYWVKRFRLRVERPTKIPWPLPKPERHHDRCYITDVVDDLTVGIPDVDYVGLPFSLYVKSKYVGVGRTATGLVPLHFVNPDVLLAHGPGYWYPQPNDPYRIKDGIPVPWTDQEHIISRWKSMIRPIYHKIYEDKDELNDPRTTKYINYDFSIKSVFGGDGVIRTPGTRYLGEIDNLPWGRYAFGADSPKYRWLDPHTFGDTEYRSQIREGYGKTIYHKLDEAISDRISHEVSKDESLDKAFKGFIQYVKIGKLVKTFMGAFDTPTGEWRRENTEALLSGIQIVLQSILKPKTDPITGAVTGIGIVPRDAILDKMGSIDWVGMAIGIISSVYASIAYEYSRENPERTSLQPLRVFKKGGVVLKSRSGQYFHTNEPCPIIFLGFNDKNIIKAELKDLTKSDQEEEIYYRQDGRFYENKRLSYPVVSKYIMKKRSKKYGVNPLLDIFYLNIAEKSSEHTARIPFRPGPNTNPFDWPKLSKGQLPSMFPPLWNEPVKLPIFWNTIVDFQLAPDNKDYKKKVFGLTEEAQFGDIFWEKRVPNTILPLEERWSLSLKEEQDNSYTILTDKTPILDIYNQLMEMHVKGTSWEEILKYVSIAKSSITGNRYSEKIDLKILEDLNLLLQSKLHKLDRKLDENSSQIQILPISFETIDFNREYKNSELKPLGDESFIKVLFESPNNPIYIDDIIIKPSDYKQKDIYGNLSSELFEINLSIFERGNPNLNVEGLTFSNLKKRTPLKPNTWYQFGIRFKQNVPGIYPLEDSKSWRSIQPLFNYNAIMHIYGNVNTPAGDGFDSITPLTATVSTDKKITNTYDTYYNEPLNLPSKIDMGFGEEGEYDVIKENIKIGNYTDSDIVRVISVEINNINVYRKNGKELEIIFPIYDENGELTQKSGEIFYSDFQNSSAYRQILQPTPNGQTPYFYEFELGFNPFKFNNANILPEDDIFYAGKLTIQYERKNAIKIPFDIQTVSSDSKYLKWNQQKVEIPIIGYSKKQ